jgi:hypothetical protein
MTTLIKTNTVEEKMSVARALMLSSNGRFMTVKFMKKDGSERVMTCRLGVKTPLVGGENTVKHIAKYITVWDSKKKEYRNINLETVQFIHVNKQHVEFAA